MGIIAVILAAIPITLFLLSRQQQTKSGATAATILSLTPPSATKKVGDTQSFDIVLDPGGTNQVSFVKLVINYDSTKLKVPDNGLIVSPVTSTNKPLSSVLEGPTINNSSDGKGTASITVSAGADPTQIITKPTTIATITFQVLAASPAPLQIAFAPAPQTQVLSAGSDATSSENVLSTSNPATLITISTDTSVTPAPSTSPGVSQNPTPTSSTSATNQPPVCTSLTLDRTPSGASPLSLTFTAIGNDPDDAIQKVTFNFGDGPVQDVFQGGGIGSKTLTGVQLGHTYSNAGTYTASAILTDNSGSTSNPSTCTQTITVTAPTTGTTGSGRTTGTTTSGGSGTSPQVPGAQSPQAANPPASKPPVSGPSGAIIGIGAGGIILSGIGAIILFML